jgi:hypothetical protein
VMLSFARRGGRCAVGAPTGAVSASLRLRCGARGRGRAEQLAAFASLSTLKHVRRVRSGCARVRAPTSTPALLAAPQVAPTAHRPPRGTGCSLRANNDWPREGVAGVRAACVGGAEERRACGRARIRALRQLTRGRCLSATSAASEASSAAGRKTEHRKAVVPQARPPRSRAARTPATPLPRANRRTRVPGKSKPITNA